MKNLDSRLKIAILALIVLFILVILRNEGICQTLQPFIRVEEGLTKVDGVVTNDTSSRLGKVANLFNAGAHAEASTHGGSQNIALNFSSLKYGEKGVTATTSLVLGVYSETGWEGFLRLGKGVYPDGNGARIGLGGGYYIRKPETLNRTGEDASKWSILARVGLEIGHDGSAKLEFRESGVMESINDQFLAYAFQYGWTLDQFQYIRDAFNDGVELLKLGRVGGTSWYATVSATAEARYRILPPLYATGSFDFTCDIAGLSRPDKRGLFQPALRLGVIVTLPFNFEKRKG